MAKTGNATRKGGNFIQVLLGTVRTLELSRACNIRGKGKRKVW